MWRRDFVVDKWVCTLDLFLSAAHVCVWGLVCVLSTQDLSLWLQDKCACLWKHYCVDINILILSKAICTCEMYSSLVMSEPDRGVKGFCSGTAPINVSRDHVSICILPPLYVGVSQKYWHDLLWMQCDQSFPWKQSYAHFFNRLGGGFFVVEFEFFCNEKWFGAILCNRVRESGLTDSWYKRQTTLAKIHSVHVT